MDLPNGQNNFVHFLNILNFISSESQVDELSNKVANIFINSGFQAGDTVALLLDNRPEYVAIWLGLAKAGIVTALINYNVKGTPLVHSLKIVDTKAVIFGAQFVEGEAK